MVNHPSVLPDDPGARCLSPSLSFSPRARQRGFTLMEMVVVMFIVGIIATFAVISLNRDPADLVEEEARRLHALLQLAMEEAVLQSQELAVEFHRDGYRFMRLEHDGTNWTWVPLAQDRILRPRCLHELVVMEVALDGEQTELTSLGCAAGNIDRPDAEDTADKDEEESDQPRIFVLSSGELTPFEISLPINEDGASYRLVGRMHGEVQYLRPGEEPDDV